jgi:tripartite-type tricarboxylate transporter receptor subunit TctC
LTVHLGNDLGTSVIVDNIGGGAGLPAIAALARAPTDGYTLMMGGASQVTIQPLVNKSGAEAAKKLLPISMVMTSPHVLFVSSKIPVHTLEEFVAYGRSNPEALNFAWPGTGSVSHLGMEVILSRAGISGVHVAYKGMAQATLDLASGQVQAMLSSMPSLKSMVDKQLIRPIGLSSESSAKDTRGLPLISSVIAGAQYTTWYAMYASVGTQPQTVKFLSKAFSKVLEDPTLREKYRQQGMELAGSSPQDVAARTQTETSIWADTISKARIKLE